MATPQYRIQIRDNTLTPIGELTDYIDGDILLNFNDVGAFVLTVKADQDVYAVRNLYSPNQSSVETDTSGFAAFVGGSGTMTRDTSEHQFGAASLKLITDGSATFQFVNAQLSSGVFTPGLQYTASFYVKSSAATGTLRYFVDSDAGAVSAVNTLTLSTSWTRYSVTFAAVAGLAWMGIRLDTGSPAQALTFFLDGLQIEAGATLSSWMLGGALVLNTSPVGGVAQLFAAGNGVIISRDRGDGSGAQTLISGPFWHLERRLKDNTYVLSGPDDLWWLKARVVNPVVGYPYSATILADTPIRYYRLGEPSGTTATDASAHANGTYVNSPTLGVAGGIDDSNTAVTFAAASSQRVSLSDTGLPSGNSAWSIEKWFKVASLPAGTQILSGWGTAAASKLASVVMTASGIFTSVFGSATAARAPSLGVWHHFVSTWDGTTLKDYLDTVVGTGVSPGALNVTLTGTAYIGVRTDLTLYYSGSEDEVAFYNYALTPAQVALHYAVGKSRYAADAYDTRTGTASTIIRGYVNDNAVAGAVTSRQVFGLTLAADPAIGSSVTGNARFDNLLALIQQLAVSGGDIGFKCVQTDVGVLTFTIYQPATQSNAIFSRELGNLLDAIYTLVGPNANSYLGAGGGSGTARVLVSGSDSGSIASWGTVEGFLDARDTSDVPTISQRITAQLATDAQQTNLNITPTDTAALEFGRDYNLGDIVNVRIDGTTITDKIRQLHIQLNSTDQELVTPGIGNAGAGQIAALFDAKQRALAAVQKQLARLQAAQ